MIGHKGAPIGNRNAAGHHPGHGRNLSTTHQLTGGIPGGRYTELQHKNGMRIFIQSKVAQSLGTEASRKAHLNAVNKIAIQGKAAGASYAAITTKGFYVKK